VRDLLEMRQVLESLAARRAAQRVDDASLEELEQILQEAEKKRLAGDAMASRSGREDDLPDRPAPCRGYPDRSPYESLGWRH